MAKFRNLTATTVKVISADMLNFKPVSDTSPLKKILKETLSAVGNALLRLSHSLARAKIW